MAPSVPTIEPTAPVAGDSWKWDKTLTAYPAGEGWQLSYYVRGPIDIDIDWGTEVTASGDVFQVRVEETKTDDLTAAGAYDLIGRVTDGTDTYTVVRCRINVQANPATAVNAKSLAVQMVEALDAALLANPESAGVVRVQINGRTIEYGSPDEAQRARDRWNLQVEIERNPNARLTHAARMVAS